MSILTLRPYQEQCRVAVHHGWADARRQLIVLPTGTGKTVVFAKIAEDTRKHGRTLVLAHREELLSQAREKIAAWTPLSTALEQAGSRADDVYADVVVASVQTLIRRLDRYRRDAFALLVIDEAHHAPAETYQRIVDHFDAKVLGVTATPDRLDKRSLGDTFDAVPFVYELRDAIADGWLVPIRQKIVRIHGMDLSAVRTSHGDLQERDLEMAMLRADVVHGVARATVEASKDRRTLVFCTTIAHAHAVATAMGHFANPQRIEVLTGQDSADHRREGVRRFATGETQFLVNCMLFTEGFDLPEIASVSIARPTKSRALYAQMIGRGTRTASGKRDLLILDFVGNAGRHVLINAFDILGGADAEIQARISARAEAGADGCDVLAEIRRAQEELAEFNRRQALEAARRAREAHIEYVEVDPFRRVYSILKIRPVAGRMGGVEPTKEQIDLLYQYKVHQDIDVANLDRGQAAEILARIKERPRLGLCTYKQARVLLKYGYDPDISFKQAGEIITEIAKTW